MRRGLIEEKTPPEWNIRVFTEDDFHQYCDAEGIVIREEQVEQPGLYLICDGTPTIFIDDQLRGAERLFVEFHELAHHWLHPPGVRMFFGLGKTIELEADVVAICALIPKTVLIHYWPSEIVDIHGYSHWMVQFRCEVFDRYKI
ncbi:MAG TPA: ImmA/IrrE family metallo-endopeptidase [Blastocatellia bacterium]|nr:ImmA/IrrE family metallo-endopeptidase [Blastocatellia bacterium]